MSFLIESGRRLLTVQWICRRSPSCEGVADARSVRSTRELPPTSPSSRRQLERYLGRRARRGRLPGLPPEQRHLRPAPGRHTTRWCASRCPTARITPEQLDMLGHIADDLLPGLGPHHHPPERPVPLRRARAGPRGHARLLASVGLTTREACGDTVRNVHGLPPRRRLPVRGASTSPVGRGRLPALPAPPASPSACPASSRSTSRAATPTAARRCSTTSAWSPPPARLDDGTDRAGLPGVHRRRPRRQPAPGAGPRGVHRQGRPAAHHRGGAAGVRADRQPRQQAAGPPEVGRRRAGLRRAAAPRVQGPPRSCWPRRRWPGGIPEVVQKHGDAPAGAATGVTPTAIGQGTPGRAPRHQARTSAGSTPTSSAAWPRAPSRPCAYARLGDITSDQFRALAVDPARARRSTCASPTARTSCFRGLTEAAAADAVRPARAPSAWPSPAPSWPATSSPAPAPTPATWPSPSPAGWPTPSAPRSRRPAWPRSAASAPTSPAAPTRAASTTSSDIGFFGAERRAHGQPAPGYQMLLGGYVGQEQMHFGEKALRLPAKNAPEAAVRVVRRFADEREAGEAFRGVAGAVGGAKAIAADLQGPRRVPRRPKRRPSSTSTSARPAPTSPRSASRSAPHDRHGHRVEPFDVAHARPTTSPTRELAELNGEFERLPASKIIQWAVDNFAPAPVPRPRR